VLAAHPQRPPPPRPPKHPQHHHHHQQTVVDTSGGCGASYEVSVVSAAFAGKTLLARHRLINDALRAEMAHIHALSVKRAEAPPPPSG